MVWRDSARAWQQYGFGGRPNPGPGGVKARNRLAILETGGGSLAFLPPSHKFFFAREIETNLGFVYYRKTSDKSFAVGVRQADREEPYKPLGVSDEKWETTAPTRPATTSTTSRSTTRRREPGSACPSTFT